MTSRGYVPHPCIAAANAALAKAGKNTRITEAWELPADRWRIVIATEKVDKSKRAKPALVCATYCPFCGVKLYEEKAETPTDPKREVARPG